MFRSLFGGGDKEKVLRSARVEQFREAWLLANRSLLAVESEAQEEGKEIEPDMLVHEAEQWIRDSKTTFTSDAHKTEKLTQILLPLVNEIFQAAHKFRDDADVSSAHNSTTQRILELVTKKIRAGEKLSNAQPSDELSAKENEIFMGVMESAARYWNAK